MITFGIVDTLLDAERLTGSGFGMRYREQPDGTYMVYMTDWTLIRDRIIKPLWKTMKTFGNWLNRITEIR